MNNPKYHIIPIARYAARFSLLFGLLQVAIFAIYPNDISIEFGIAHLYPSIVIHLVLLLLVLINSLRHGLAKRENLITIGWILLNIPMAYLCFILVVIRYGL
jgi:hypothetical protein